MNKRERKERKRQQDAEEMRALAERMRQEMEPLAIDTRTFLGDIRDCNAHVGRATTYGLGGVTIDVTGRGNVTIHKFPFMPSETSMTHKLSLPEADVQELFAAFIADDFARLVIPEHTGYPDEPSYDIALTNAAGQTRRAGKFVRCDCPPFQRLVAAFGTIVGKHLDAKLREKLTF